MLTRLLFDFDDSWRGAENPTSQNPEVGHPHLLLRLLLQGRVVGGRGELGYYCASWRDQ
jgi:hypothetical protein